MLLTGYANLYKNNLSNRIEYENKIWSDDIKDNKEQIFNNNVEYQEKTFEEFSNKKGP